MLFTKESRFFRNYLKLYKFYRKAAARYSIISGDNASVTDAAQRDETIALQPCREFDS